MEYVYAALLLHKLGKNVEEEKIVKVLEAAGAEVDESKVKSLLASLKDIDLESELEKASFVSSPAEKATGAKHEKKEDKPKEEKKAAAAEGLSALFG